MKLSDHVHSKDYEFNPDKFQDYLSLTSLKLANQVLVQHADMLLVVKTEVMKEDDPSFKIYTLPIESKKNTSGVWDNSPDTLKTRILTGTITELRIYFQILHEEELAKVGDDKDLKKSILEVSKKVITFFSSFEKSPNKLNDIIKLMNIVIVTRIACFKMIKNLKIVDERDLDSHLNYLGAPNGVINLETGELICGPKAAALLITHKIRDPYDPEAGHPMAEQLFAGIGLDAKNYVKQEFAFSLRGIPSKRMLFFNGPKDSGKSALSSAFAAALGDYGSRLHPSVLAASKNNEDPSAASPYMFSIAHPMRYSYGDERENQTYDAARVKRFSSGGIVNARHLYGNPVERPVTATIANLSNWLPESGLKLKDSAVRSRLRVIQCEEIPEDERNMYLDEARMALSDHCELRQSLIAHLIQIGVEQQDNKPQMPSKLLQYQEIVRREDLNEIGVWLIENIQKDETGRLFIREVMVALRRTYERVGKEDVKIGDTFYSTKKVSKEIQKIFDMKEPQPLRCQHIPIGGVIKGDLARGWRGLILGEIKIMDSDEDQSEMDEF